MLATLPLAFLIAFGIGSPSKYGVKQTVRIESFKNCPQSNYPVQLNDVRIEQVDKTTFVVNSALNVPKGMLPISAPKGRFTLKRCASRADKNMCEHYMRFEVNDLCERFKEDGQAWSGLVKALKPPLVCPIDKTTYVQTNGTMDADLVGKVTPEGFVWTYQLEVFHRGKTIFCHVGSYQIQRVKEIEQILGKRA